MKDTARRCSVSCWASSRRRKWDDLKALAATKGPWKRTSLPAYGCLERSALRVLDACLKDRDAAREAAKSYAELATRLAKERDAARAELVRVEFSG